MMSLFSSFDFKIFGLMFIFSLMLILMFLFNIQKKISFFKVILIFLNLNLYSSINSIKAKKTSKFMISMFSCIFFSLVIVNFNSIFPFNFPFSTQISFIFFYSMCFWLSFLFFSMNFNLKKLISHKIPEGSPIFLSFFLFLIEIISDLIRPITLSLRLVGNMMVGHVLLSLLFNLVCFYNLIFPIFLILNMVEILVCMIQSYIFFTLICMYSSEM